MKHIFLLNSGARPLILNRLDDNSASHDVVMAQGCCEPELVVLTLGCQGVFCESVACVWSDTPSSTSSLAFGETWVTVPGTASWSQTGFWNRHTSDVTLVVARERWRWEGWMSNFSDAGPGFRVQRFCLRSTPLVLCCVNAACGYFWCGCQVSPAPPRFTVAHNKTRGYLSNRVDSSGQWESDRCILWFTKSLRINYYWLIIFLKRFFLVIKKPELPETSHSQIDSKH